MRMYWPSRLGRWCGPEKSSPVRSTSGERIASISNARSHSANRIARLVRSSTPTVTSTTATKYSSDCAGTSPSVSFSVVISATAWAGERFGKNLSAPKRMNTPPSAIRSTVTA